MRSPLRSGWFRAFAAWTVVVAIPIVLLLPSATSSLPCRYQSERAADPALPVCPPDMFNVAAVYVVLLGLLWMAGVGIEAGLFLARLVIGSLRGRARGSG